MTNSRSRDLPLRWNAALERAASMVDGETCSGKCECYSCEMLNKIAADIRSLKDDEETLA